MEGEQQYFMICELTADIKRSGEHLLGLPHPRLSSLWERRPEDGHSFKTEKSFNAIPPLSETPLCLRRPPFKGSRSGLGVGGGELWASEDLRLAHALSYRPARSVPTETSPRQQAPRQPAPGNQGREGSGSHRPPEVNKENTHRSALLALALSGLG